MRLMEIHRSKSSALSHYLPQNRILARYATIMRRGERNPSATATWRFDDDPNNCWVGFAPGLAAKQPHRSHSSAAILLPPSLLCAREFYPALGEDMRDLPWTPTK
jgi:hypothetical protein